MPRVSRNNKPTRSKSRALKRPTASSVEVRHRMQVTKRRDTPGELALRSALRAYGVRYRVDAKLPGSRRRADVAFFWAKVAVFVDGCFWHGCPKHGSWPKTNAEWWQQKIRTNQRRDRDTDHMLKAQGWTVLRFWEHTDPITAARRIVKVLKARHEGRNSEASR